MKALYIFEFSRNDAEVECEWFVDELIDDYQEQFNKCYKHLQDTVFEGDGLSINDIRKNDYARVENVYLVQPELIREVYDSYV